MQVENTNSCSEITYKWDLPNEKISSLNWTASEYFNFPNNDNVKFCIYFKRYAGARLKVKKIGTLKETFDIELKIGDSKMQSTTLLGSKSFSDELIFKDINSKGPYRISCKVEFQGCNKYGNIYVPILNKMENYLFSSELSDVTIKVENETFSAHKIVLGKNSPVLETMLNSKKQKKCIISFKGFDKETVEEVLRFLYTGKVEKDNDSDLILKLLSFADKYQVKILMDFSETKLIKTLTADNVIEILVATDKYDLVDFKKNAIKFMIENKAYIEFTDAIKQINNSKVIWEFFFEQSGMKNSENDESSIGENDQDSFDSD
ncbi:BTB and MATH domain-containing protein 40-like [Cotesia glomerata]|uniref:BTB and MATH domain-containing protein 40-like n=1 Tax=Cotesia glomerata TaxID=32391 RepID=UPI001D022CDF|nr:BTB and MATH domain-containing protein 40-like [Cotesia glomerata]